MERIYTELASVKLLQQATSHTVDNILAEAKKTNGRISSLEGKDRNREVEDAKESVRSESAITWRAIGQIGTIAGAVSAIVAVVVRFA